MSHIWERATGSCAQRKVASRGALISASGDSIWDWDGGDLYEPGELTES